MNEDGDTCCGACGVNLEQDACRCGPAGPYIDGVWTGENLAAAEPAQPKRYADLAAVLRQRAQRMIDANESSDADISDTAELMKVLARMVEGKTVYEAFGAPGDWGYETAIGQALKAAYR